jgi:hypothetical protein
MKDVLSYTHTHRLATNLLWELVVPYAKFWWRRNKEGKGQQDQDISQPELEHWLEKVCIHTYVHTYIHYFCVCLLQYDPNMSLLNEYADIVIQFGFTALFVSALPFASSFGLLSNIVSVKSNVWRRFNVLQRPFPAGAEDIGFW